MAEGIAQTNLGPYLQTSEAGFSRPRAVIGAFLFSGTEKLLNEGGTTGVESNARPLPGGRFFLFVRPC